MMPPRADLAAEDTVGAVTSGEMVGKKTVVSVVLMKISCHNANTGRTTGKS